MLPDKYDQVNFREKIIKPTWTTAKSIEPEGREGRNSTEGLAGTFDYIYIVTNGADSRVADPREALHDLGGRHIESNRDLCLTWEQRFVARAVNMLVAQSLRDEFL